METESSDFLFASSLIRQYWKFAYRRISYTSNEILVASNASIAMSDEAAMAMGLNTILYCLSSSARPHDVFCSFFDAASHPVLFPGLSASVVIPRRHCYIHREEKRMCDALGVYLQQTMTSPGICYMANYLQWL